MIAVTGMHRSGTSFTCNLLHAMGADCGEDDLLLERDVWNQKGYFENREVLALNNRLILGKGPAELYEKVLASSLSEGMKANLKSLLNLPSFIFPTLGSMERRAFQCSEKIGALSSKYRNVVIKDVRFSLTVGAWRTHGEIEKVLYCYRHPMEVAMSLKKRQHIPLWKGLQLWRQHVERFFQQAEGLPVVVANYHNLMGGEDLAMTEMRRLYAFLEQPFDEANAREVLASVREEGLYHNRRPEVALPKRIDELWNMLSTLHDHHDELIRLEDCHEG
jgi:hypothetical protein